MADGVRPARSWGIAAIAFVGGVGGGVVFPILPLVGMELGISGLLVGVILAANRITRLGFNPLTGLLIDRFGARWPVAAGLAIEALGTLAFSIGLAAAHSAGWFLIGRVVWGVGSSLLMVGSLAAVLAIAPPERRAGLTARVRTSISLGLPAGLVIGGLVADRFSANAAFLTATALSLAGAIAAVFVLPAVGGRPRPPPATAGEPQRHGRFGDGWRGLWRIPVLRVVWSANGLLFFAVSGVLLASLAVMVAARGLQLPGFGVEGSAGLYMAVMMGARGIASLASGRYLDRVASRTGLLLPATVAVALGLLGLAFAEQAVTAALLLLLVGAGAGGLTIPLLTLLGDASPPALHGRALSVYQWAGDLGGSLGPIVGLELGQRLGFDVVYAVTGACMLALAVPLWRWAVIARR